MQCPKCGEVRLVEFDGQNCYCAVCALAWTPGKERWAMSIAGDARRLGFGRRRG